MPWIEFSSGGVEGRGLGSQVVRPGWNARRVRQSHSALVIADEWAETFSDVCMWLWGFGISVVTAVEAGKTKVALAAVPGFVPTPLRSGPRWPSRNPGQFPWREPIGKVHALSGILVRSTD